MVKTFEECLQSKGVVSLDLNAPDFAKLAADAITAAVKETGRNKILYPSIMDQEKFALIKSLCDPKLDFMPLDAEGITKCNSIASLNAMLDNTVAAVYFENPVKPGISEPNAAAIVSASRHSCAVVIIGLGEY